MIGVNIEIFTTTGSNSGVGFAVPISNAYEFATNIVAGTPIETAYLGVTGDSATGAQSGALITEIVSGSAAESAVLRSATSLPRSMPSRSSRSTTSLPGSGATCLATRLPST